VGDTYDPKKRQLRHVPRSRIVALERGIPRTSKRCGILKKNTAPSEITVVSEGTNVPGGSVPSESQGLIKKIGRESHRGKEIYRGNPTGIRGLGGGLRTGCPRWRATKRPIGRAEKASGRGVSRALLLNRGMGGWGPRTLNWKRKGLEQIGELVSYTWSPRPRGLLRGEG